MVSRSSLQSGTLAPAITAASGPPWPSASTLFLVPFLPRSVGFFPTFFPPETGLTHAAVGGLPLPVHRGQLVALLGELRPDALHDAARAPALEPAVDGALGAEAAGQLVPLAAGAHAEDDAVQRPAPVGVAAAGGLL